MESKREKQLSLGFGIISKFIKKMYSGVNTNANELSPNPVGSILSNKESKPIKQSVR